MDTQFEIAPRKQVTLILLKDESSVHLCMYGAENPSSWTGDVCESDQVARACAMFKPRVGLDEARASFLESLVDDEFTFNNYRDVATLQWVLGERVHEYPISVWERFLFWIRKTFWRPSPPNLPSSHFRPEDLWYDPKDDSLAASGSRPASLPAEGPSPSMDRNPG